MATNSISLIPNRFHVGFVHAQFSIRMCIACTEKPTTTRHKLLGATVVEVGVSTNGDDENWQVTLEFFIILQHSAVKRHQLLVVRLRVKKWMST